MQTGRLIWLLGAGLALFWAPLISFVVSRWGLDLEYRPSTTEFMVSISSLIISLIGAAAVALTLYLQFITARDQQTQITENYKLAKYGYNLQVFGHIENLFLSEKYLECRTQVWQFWSEYNRSDEQEKAAIEADIKMLLTESIYDSWTPEGLKKFNSQQGRYFQEIFKLLRYFDVISNFDFDRETAQAFYFYYVYYRRLIVTIETLYRQAYGEAGDGGGQRVKLPMHGWHDLDARLERKLAPLRAAA